MSPRLATFLLAIVLAGPIVLAQRAATIDSIAPLAARPGDAVTITGNGFGAINVRITVGGVPAPVLTANGNSVTFRVPSGAPQGATTVRATNPGGQSNEIAFSIIEGVLLSGAPGALATAAETDVPPTSANRGDIDAAGLILTRLGVEIVPDATVAQVNDALLLVQGGIVSMRPGGLYLTFAIPRQTSSAGIDRLVQLLKTAPGVAYAFPAVESASQVLPPGSQLVGDQLFPTRFPAAWNAQRLARQDCTSRRVPIIVADNFQPTLPAGYSAFSTEIPASSFTSVNALIGDSTHGYDVTTTIAAAFDGAKPTGANPFVECLDVRALNITGLSTPDVIDLMIRSFPSGRFLLNFSQGYAHQCAFTLNQNQEAICNDSWVRTNAAPAILRAKMAALWKLQTRTRWQDFLAAASAGNANDPTTPDGLLSAFYPGVGTAVGNSVLSGATDFDPFFGFAVDHSLWDNQIAQVNLIDLTAAPAEFAQLHDAIVLGHLDTVGPADNVMVVGSATAGNTFATLQDSAFANRIADVLAVGEHVLMLDGSSADGTSFAAPQVTALASYLWLLSDELRHLPNAITATHDAIFQNARALNLSAPVVDAYASILSLDKAALPSPATAPVRLAILDANDDSHFNESDLDLYLAHLLDNNGTPVEPLAPDYSRYDLNGDGFTGGTTRVDAFDLDRIGSTQFGAPAVASDVTQTIESVETHFDEQHLTDLQILCYYAYSALYTGDPGARTARLGGTCSVTVSVAPNPVTVVSGGTQQFSVTVRGTSDTRVTWSTNAPGATISSTGLFTAGATAGTFIVTATSFVNASAKGTAQVTVTGTGPGHGSGTVRANAGAHAQNDPECLDLALKVSDVQSFSKSFHCIGRFITVDGRTLTGTADATTTFSETAVLGEVTFATATGVYVTDASGPLNPDLPLGENNTNAESQGSYKLAFTVTQPRVVRLTGTLTGNASSTVLQFSCGDVALGTQAGGGGVDRTFTVPAGGFCSITVSSTARARIQVPPLESPTAGFNLQIEVH